MEIFDTESEQKKKSRNIESSVSKLDEINKILEPTDWDKFGVKTVKKNLSQLLIDKKYALFQEKIGMPHKLCDGLLGQKTLDYLLRYIIGVEDEAEDSLGEAVKHIGEIFKFGKSKYIAENNAPFTVTPGTPTINKIMSEPLNTINTISTPMFGTTPLSEIKSCPVIKSEESESYCCSKTARLNGLRFGVHLPRGNAYAAGIFPTTGSIGTIPKEKVKQKPDKTWDAIGEEDFNSFNEVANFADIYARSSTTYGHRAIAIRDSQGKWYLLDPYIKINGRKTLTPIRLGDYVKKGRKIVKAHFYHSDGYIN